MTTFPTDQGANTLTRVRQMFQRLAAGQGGAVEAIAATSGVVAEQLRGNMLAAAQGMTVFSMQVTGAVLKGVALGTPVTLTTIPVGSLVVAQGLRVDEPGTVDPAFSTTPWSYQLTLGSGPIFTALTIGDDAGATVKGARNIGVGPSLNSTSATSDITVQLDTLAGVSAIEDVGDFSVFVQVVYITLLQSSAAAVGGTGGGAFA